MPFGFERINVKQQPPNPYINFYKPLDGPDHDTALDFLHRIAAICTPIMKNNGIRVMSIEEFPPNKDFLGRNFNGGECVQLVLKSHSGNWLHFRYVQKVMMHELAHNAQMNHSKKFWKVRNKYCEELEDLWKRGYLGDGLWGRGVNLYDGQLASMEDAARDSALIKDLCGGTHRRRSGGKRRPNRPSQLTCAERQARRLKKKFGEGGHQLGDDDQVKAMPENGKKIKGKPRVAVSNRGRELRAAAALTRFQQPSVTSAASLSQDEDYEYLDDSNFDDIDVGPEARGVDGERVFDRHLQRLVQVYEGQDTYDGRDARRETEEHGGNLHGHDRSQKRITSPKDTTCEMIISTASESKAEFRFWRPSTPRRETEGRDRPTVIDLDRDNIH